jgi:ABC-type proline/glycine betaine transport system permease subunit
VLKARAIPEEIVLRADAPGATPRQSLVPIEIAVGMLTVT